MKQGDIPDDIDIPAFQGWLAKGHGRAARLLQKHGVAPYREALLHACTHHLGYDKQSEDSRAPYLWKLIELSKERPFFHKGLLFALKEHGRERDDYDWSQIFALARHFVLQNDKEMKQAMYSAFEALGFDKAGVSSADHLVRLDGVEGFLFVVRQYAIEDSSREGWELDSLMSELEECIGKEEAGKIIAEKAQADPKLGPLLQAVIEHRRLWDEGKARQEKPAPTVGYSVIKSQIEKMSNTYWPEGLHAWSKSATAEELKAAADDLLAEKDARKLQAYFRIFRNLPFPGDIDGLLAFVDDEREKVRHFAVSAASNVSNPAVRRKALALLNSPERAGHGAELLQSNFQAGDFSLIEQALQRTGDIDVIHDLGFAVRRILEKNLTPDAEKALLVLYEKNPCALCRADCVRFLLVLEKLPEWMRHECAYDADGDTVKLVG